MQSEIILDTEHATLIYYPDHQMVHHEFHKPVAGAEFRGILDKGVDVFREHHATKWLSDDRKNAALSEADVAWGFENWFPRVLASGWKFWALVVPNDMMARMNLNQFIGPFMEKGIMVRVFADPDEAKAWLSSQ